MRKHELRQEWMKILAVVLPQIYAEMKDTPMA
jgi:hypothetical protein